jgi:hypothetical protein
MQPLDALPRELPAKTGRASSSARWFSVQLSPNALPRNVVLGISKCLASATLDLGSPCRLDLAVSLAIQTRKEVGSKFGTFWHG